MPRNYFFPPLGLWLDREERRDELCPLRPRLHHGMNENFFLKNEKNTFCEFLAQLDDGRVLVVGGEGPDDQVVTAIEFYDADADEWTVSEVIL